MKKIAILYQEKPPPMKQGVSKPMKEGGYSDSGADIAFELKKCGIEVVVPVETPRIDMNYDWVFPDNTKGIEAALGKGANVFWLNTVLYKNHPIESYLDANIEIVGQLPVTVDLYDDKFYTNNYLSSQGIPFPKSELIKVSNLNIEQLCVRFPILLKPLRGRGSQGVKLFMNSSKLMESYHEYLDTKKYGEYIYAEEYLSGQEITITIMPQGTYQVENVTKVFDKPWCLPVVERYNHVEGIAPYSGIVAVSANSCVMDRIEQKRPTIEAVCKHCIAVAQTINIKAPIRVDCRADKNGMYYLFDINLKPNVTGASRPHRKSQESLTLLAAKEMGWNYGDLLQNLVRNSWGGSSQV